MPVEAEGRALVEAEGKALVAAEGVEPVTTWLVMLAEQSIRPPPPEPEPLHWLIVMTRAEAIVPLAMQSIPTRWPPLAEPLHWVIAASTVVAGKGSQPVVMPSPEPTH